ncbi:MAG: DUF624 domain-containing protein [Chloroflexi bacterium]|nr:DUF624 domain-containing protein [Chloroflexota bacterium]
MKDAFRTFWEALKDFWDELFLLTLMNIVTALLAIPVVTLPPALAGLWNAANLAAKGKTISWSDYFGGFRRYFWKAWGLALLHVLVIIILLTNIWFYGQEDTPFKISATVRVWIQAFFVVAGALWMLYQMYPLAMLLEQEDQRLRMTLRNAAIVFIANPTFSIVLGLLLLVVTAVSVLLPMLWFLITLALFAVVCNKAVLHLLKPHRERIKTESDKEH